MLSPWLLLVRSLPPMNKKMSRRIWRLGRRLKQPIGTGDKENIDLKGDKDDKDCVNLVANERKLSSDPLCLFTTGLGFLSEDKSRLRAVFKSAGSKHKCFDTFVAHPSLFCLVCWWAWRHACNFAANVLNINFVVAREIGLGSAFQLRDLCGWILTRRFGMKDPFHIEHKVPQASQTS
jgi:hypothetical protein